MNHIESISTPFPCEQLAETGTGPAIEKTGQIKKRWNKQVYQMLLEFIPQRKQFMCEEFRNYCNKKGLALPSSNRAFGGIILRAVREGKIRRVGYNKVKNPKAHAANATLWETVATQ